MATRSLASLRVLFESLVTGSKSVVPADIQNATPPGSASIRLVLTAGANTITVPATAKGAVIIFDPTSTTVKTLKGVGGDTGIVLSKNSWTVLSFDTTPTASFVIDSTGTDTGKYTEIAFF